MKAFAVWIVLMGAQPALAGSAEWVVFQAESVKNPAIQFVVTRSQDNGTAGLLWKGDYLWARCRPRSSKSPNKPGFTCGRQSVEWNPRTGHAELTETGKPSEGMRPLYFAKTSKHRSNR